MALTVSGSLPTMGVCLQPRRRLTSTLRRYRQRRRLRPQPRRYRQRRHLHPQSRRYRRQPRQPHRPPQCSCRRASTAAPKGSRMRMTPSAAPTSPATPAATASPRAATAAARCGSPWGASTTTPSTTCRAAGAGRSPWRRRSRWPSPPATTCTQSSEYESDEYGQALFSLNGTLYGAAPNDYFARIAGDGNGGGNRSTGWALFQADLGTLPAGTHTLTFGGFNNKKTYSDEWTEIPDR